MSRTIYYKVVKKDLTSCLVPNEFAVQYKIGEWVKAPTRTKLFLFNSLWDARSWITSQELTNKNIYKCHARYVGKYSWVFPVYLRNFTDWMRTLKKQIRSKKKFDVDHNALPLRMSAIFAREVKLLEKVEE